MNLKKEHYVAIKRVAEDLKGDPDHVQSYRTLFMIVDDLEQRMKNSNDKARKYMANKRRENPLYGRQKQIREREERREARRRQAAERRMNDD